MNESKCVCVPVPPQAQAVSGRAQGPAVRTPTCGQWRTSCSISEILIQCWLHMLTFSENMYVFTPNDEDKQRYILYLRSHQISFF